MNSGRKGTFTCHYVRRDGAVCGVSCVNDDGCKKHRGKRAAKFPSPCHTCGKRTVAAHVVRPDTPPVPLCGVCSNYVRQARAHKAQQEAQAMNAFVEALVADWVFDSSVSPPAGGNLPKQ